MRIFFLSSPARIHLEQEVTEKREVFHKALSFLRWLLLPIAWLFLSPLLIFPPRRGRRESKHCRAESGRLESSHRPRATSRVLQLCPFLSRATGCGGRG